MVSVCFSSIFVTSIPSMGFGLTWQQTKLDLNLAFIISEWITLESAKYQWSMGVGLPWTRQDKERVEPGPLTTCSRSTLGWFGSGASNVDTIWDGKDSDDTQSVNKKGMTRKLHLIVGGNRTERVTLAWTGAPTPLLAWTTFLMPGHPWRSLQKTLRPDRCRRLHGLSWPRWCWGRRSASRLATRSVEEIRSGRDYQ